VQPAPTLTGLVDTRAQYAHVFDIYVPIALGVFALVALLVLGAVLVYRRRPLERAARWHEHNPSESAYALILVATIAFLLYVTFSAEHQVDTVSASERPALVVNVTGSKWEWRFGYPAYAITLHSGADGIHDLVVPSGEPVRFRLTSTDVIHSFWIPELRYKHDATPGSVQRFTLVFAQRGVIGGECAEFCGFLHSRMLFNVRVVSPAQFAAWVAANRGTTT
jgi:cytochrome c oxidase subunit II